MSTSALPSPALSVTGRRWQPVLTAETWRISAALSQQTGLPLVVAQLLASRGITTPQAAETFLNPRLDQLPDPLTLKDCAEAVILIIQAIDNKDKIAIFGDYDVDGTCATAILARYLKNLGIEPFLYIPDRLTEGYGPNSAAMDTIAAHGTKLLITVDTGTCAPEALNRAASLGMSVVVTDHHQAPSANPADLPLFALKTAALVNPHRPDDTSGLHMLCGSGVVFFLLMALNRELRQRGYFTDNKDIKEPKLTALLDLVALATVADVMPLAGPNRVLVMRGLQQLATGQHVGLAALSSVAGVSGPPDASTLGFHLGPRLNAAGRIDSAKLALDLLVCDDPNQANSLARQLDEKNQQRRQLEQSVLAEAIIQVEAWKSQGELEKMPVLVVSGPWHPGVVGIVASRLKERYSRPTFVLGHDGENLKGSGRGLPGLDLGAAVHACQDLLLSGGGHAMAAGLSLVATQLAELRTRLVAQFWQQIEAQPAFARPVATSLEQRLQAPLALDAVLAPAGATAELVAALAQLAPYGQGHPEPLLALTGCLIGFCKPVGSKEEHLKLSLTGAGGARVDAICFGPCDELAALLSQSGGRTITLVGHLRSRVFNGRTYLDFQIRDADSAWQIPQPFSLAA